VPELDRIVLKDTIAKRPFASIQACRKTAITTRILGLVHELCNKQINVTKRDLFYTDVKLFEVRRVELFCGSVCDLHGEGGV
jgi:meiotic recombination protein SPO11